MAIETWRQGAHRASIVPALEWQESTLCIHRQEADTLLMSVNPLLPRMHDWVLIQIMVNWEDGRVTIELTPVPLQPRALLVGLGLKSLSCPRRFDWGPSGSILEVKLQDLDSHKKLALQMQSGDLIELEANSFVLNQ